MPYKRKLKKPREPQAPVFKTIYGIYGVKRHLLGAPGPRGGQRSLCGQPASRIARWGSYCLRLGVTSNMRNISCASCRERVAA